MKKYVLLSVGELLVDLIGTELAPSILATPVFERFQGGSPANMAANMARLGQPVALISCIGNDNLGVFLRDEVAKTGIDIQHIAVDPLQPTSIVVVSRTKGTPDFIAYRTADRMLQPQHISDKLLSESAIFHTTCFALSQEPAQSTIVDAAKRANALGCRVSIDCNYAPQIWPDREQAWKVISAYCGQDGLVKLSEDDAERLYGKKVTEEQILEDFHAMGADLICLTKGGDGSVISYNKGKDKIEVGVKPIEVIDATGAGDAYWAGFLTAFSEGNTPEVCSQAGANLAALKLVTKGPLPAKVDKALLYA
ncbi:sugar kinase [Flectobacillus sp. DC10W]|jgi:fructokinase|uniref:Sugar kinase n=1 Tax=Flectobacillus longus TaxID=2984207 RepID=A0ABT6YNV6_9BACT|nr:sugar kinase [Flectobacillus longus]MDI9865137.1 sugar kinase [Flectobacillus longus]